MAGYVGNDLKVVKAPRRRKLVSRTSGPLKAPKKKKAVSVKSYNRNGVRAE